MTINPCGQVMDMLRAPYRTKCRFFRDNDTLVSIRWFFCAPKAKVFPAYHRFASRNYQTPQLRTGLVTDLDWHGVGEVFGAPRTFVPSIRPDGADGQKHCGPDADFYYGSYFDATADTEYTRDGLARCCLPDAPALHAFYWIPDYHGATQIIDCAPGDLVVMALQYWAFSVDPAAGVIGIRTMDDLLNFWHGPASLALCSTVVRDDDGNGVFYAAPEVNANLAIWVFRGGLKHTAVLSTDSNDGGSSLSLTGSAPSQFNPSFCIAVSSTAGNGFTPGVQSYTNDYNDQGEQGSAVGGDAVLGWIAWRYVPASSSADVTFALTLAPVMMTGALVAVW